MAAERHTEHDLSDRDARRTRLTIDISPDLRRRIKVAAAQSDLSVRDYLARILDLAVPAEAGASGPTQRPVTRETLERLLQARERINQGRTFPDSTELIRQMREERTRQLDEL